MEEKEVKEQNNAPSTEQLIEVCNRMGMQNNMLIKKVQELELQLQSVNRLNYLFKILEQEHLFPNSTCAKCVDEINTALFGEKKSDEQETE